MCSAFSAGQMHYSLWKYVLVDPFGWGGDGVGFFVFVLLFIYFFLPEHCGEENVNFYSSVMLTFK